VTAGKNDDTSAKKSTQGPFLKLTESAGPVWKVFEMQGLKFKWPLSAGTVYIFKPKIKDWSKWYEKSELKPFIQIIKRSSAVEIRKLTNVSFWFDTRWFGWFSILEMKRSRNDKFFEHEPGPQRNFGKG
jgi:hypothetical protein